MIKEMCKYYVRRKKVEKKRKGYKDEVKRDETQVGAKGAIISDTQCPYDACHRYRKRRLPTGSYSPSHGQL